MHASGGAAQEPCGFEPLVRLETKIRELVAKPKARSQAIFSSAASLLGRSLSYQFPVLCCACQRPSMISTCTNSRCSSRVPTLLQGQVIVDRQAGPVPRTRLPALAKKSTCLRHRRRCNEPCSQADASYQLHLVCRGTGLSPLLLATPPHFSSTPSRRGWRLRLPDQIAAMTAPACAAPTGALSSSHQPAGPNSTSRRYFRGRLM